MQYLSAIPLFYKSRPFLSCLQNILGDVGICGCDIAVTVMAFSCLGILGMWKPMTQGGQVLVLDEILGNIYK